MEEVVSSNLTRSTKTNPIKQRVTKMLAPFHIVEAVTWSPFGVQTRQNLDSSSIMIRFPCGPAQDAHRCLLRFKGVAAPYLKTARVATARSLVQTTPLGPCRSQEWC